MILDRIIETKKEEVALLKKTTSIRALESVIASLKPSLDFRAAIGGGASSIIAEVKGASPSRGKLVRDFDPLQIAKIYEQNEAAAISVLTDEKYFSGHKDYLQQIKKQVSIPILRKDFIIDPLQLYETRALGADAVLLIVRVLDEKLHDFIEQSYKLGLSALVEVHTPEELDLALTAGAGIIGINNRNLDTFVTDINLTRELQKQIPPDITMVAESGIKNRTDIECLMSAGIHAFLIGEALVTAPDIGKKLRSFAGDAR